MNNIPDRLTIEEYNGRKIIFVDYKGLKERDMIELASNVLTMTVATKFPWLADFHQTYFTRNFIEYVNLFPEKAKGIKGAIIGIDDIKSWTVKGFLLTNKESNYKVSKNKAEAIQFLTEED